MMLLRLREKRGNTKRERGGNLSSLGPVATTDIYILNSGLREQKTLTKRKPIEEGGREGSHREFGGDVRGVKPAYSFSPLEEQYKGRGESSSSGRTAGGSL